MEVIEGVKKGTKYYIYDKYIYRPHSKKNNVSYLICRIDSCSATAVLRDGTLQPRKLHNHSPDVGEIEKLRFRENLLEATNNSKESLKSIYYNVAENHQNAAIDYSYVSAERRLQRNRRAGRPPVVENFNQLANYLESENWAHLGRTDSDPPQPFYQCLVRAEDGAEILIFESPIVSEQLNVTSSIHMDGTFKIVPRGLNAQQLATIHAVYEDKLYAAIYTLMSKRTKAAYVALLTHVKVMHPQMQPTQSMCDFEVAEREAISEVFPGIKTRGCWFHYSQISEANLDAEFLPFMTYMVNYWMHQVGGPHILSVHGCSKRTNNESFQNQLFLLSGRRPHPSLWDFIKTLVTMNTIITQKFMTHQHGGKHSKSQKPTSRQQNDRIRSNEELLMSGASVGTFLERAAYSVDTLERNLRRTFQAVGSSTIQEDDVDDPDSL